MADLFKKKLKQAVAESGKRKDRDEDEVDVVVESADEADDTDVEDVPVSQRKAKKVDSDDDEDEEEEKPKTKPSAKKQKVVAAPKKSKKRPIADDDEEEEEEEKEEKEEPEAGIRSKVRNSSPSPAKPAPTTAPKSASSPAPKPAPTAAPSPAPTAAPKPASSPAPSPASSPAPKSASSPAPSPVPTVSEANMVNKPRTPTSVTKPAPKPDPPRPSSSGKAEAKDPAPSAPQPADPAPTTALPFMPLPVHPTEFSIAAIRQATPEESKQLFEEHIDIDQAGADMLLPRLLEIAESPIHFLDQNLDPVVLRNAILSVDPSMAGFFTVCAVYAGSASRPLSTDPIGNMQFETWQDSIFRLLHVFGISFEDTDKYGTEHINDRLNSETLRQLWVETGTFGCSPVSQEAKDPIALPDAAHNTFQLVPQRSIFYRHRVLERLLKASDTSPLARRALIPIALAAKSAVSIQFFSPAPVHHEFPYMASLFALPFFHDPLQQLCQLVRRHGFVPCVGAESLVCPPTIV